MFPSKKNPSTTDQPASSQNDRVLFLLLTLLALILRLAFIYFKGYAVFNGDYALPGLMGKHITEGHWMIYNYGLAYMGSLEAMVAAFFFKLAGIHVYTLYFAPLSFFMGFFYIRLVPPDI